MGKIVLKVFLTGAGVVALAFVLLVIWGMAAYSPQYVYRALAWRESDAFDWQKFPAHELQASQTPFHFEEAPDPGVAALFAELAGVADWDAFLEDHETQAFLVLQDGKVLYENYFNGTQRDSIVTSFSVAKSFASALVGKAIEEGYIASVEDPITVYLPELAARDARFEAITVRHLLLMASGLDYRELRPLLFNSDDVLTTYYPDQRRAALDFTRIVAPPGQRFSYNKYHPQLLGMILERATGMTVTGYLQSRFWEPLGMEFAGSWSTDSVGSDFEKMETGVNGRAIDFAKFGALFLNGGEWQGQQVINAEWVRASTGPYMPQDYDAYYPAYFASLPGRSYYAYMWWGMERSDGAYDFAAEGDKGQYIYVSPEKALVIVRHGLDFGVETAEWMRLFDGFARQWEVASN